MNNKLNTALNLIGCIVAALIFVGLVNPAMMSASMPFILLGTAAVLVLYVLNAFKTKNFAGMVTTVIFAAFVLAIVCYNYFIK